MQDVARVVLNKVEALAKFEALVAGKPIRDCRIEVAKVAEMFRYYAGWADKIHGEVIPVPSGHLNYTLREPLGVVFQITPWNAPLFTAGWQIAPAIATGNGVVIKPSELTPVTTVVLVAIAETVGLPKGLVNVFCGLGPTTGQAAIEHDAVRKVVFVGSPETGRRVAVAAAQALKPAVLELGGKSANIVFEDANLKQACLGAQRHLASWTLQPIAMLLAEEATNKLGQPVMVDVLRPVQGYDVSVRARALTTIVDAMAKAKEAGVDSADFNKALTLVNWGEGDNAA